MNRFNTFLIFTLISQLPLGQWSIKGNPDTATGGEMLHFSRDFTVASQIFLEIMNSDITEQWKLELDT